MNKDGHPLERIPLSRVVLGKESTLHKMPTASMEVTLASD